MLAGDFATLDSSSLVHVARPFERDVELLENLVARADQVPFHAGEIVVALEVPQSQLGARSEGIRDGTPATLDSFLQSDEWVGPEATADFQYDKTLFSFARGNETVALASFDIGSADVVQTMRQLAASQEVLWSAPNFSYGDFDVQEVTPSDPDFSGQYHHELMGNDEAWDITYGDSSIIVAITDDGIDLDHPDLVENVWVNVGEIPGNGIDDDENGYVDDVNGWDFIYEDSEAETASYDSHGTHVSGVALARTDNGIGVSGTAGQSTLMPIRFYDSGNRPAFTSSVISEAFAYAVDNGANIVSTSYNIDIFVGDPTFTAGLQYVYDQGALHFNSAGNGNELNPPREVFEQTLLVASTDLLDEKASSSNYGRGIDIAAPGVDILATYPNGGYDLKSGTSIATPNAAGVAALIWSQNPTWSREMVAAQLLGSTDSVDAANPDFVGSLGTGRVNALNALTATIDLAQIRSVTGLPADGASTDSMDIDGFSLSFDRIMDGITVDDVAGYELRSAGADGLFDTTDDGILPISLAGNYLIGSNQTTINLDDGPLGFGEYRLTVSGAHLADAFGHLLDGDSDGLAGGDYTHFFTIDEALPVSIGFDGNLTYSADFVGSITTPDEVDLYAISIDEGLSFTVVIESETNHSPNVIQPHVVVQDPDGNIVAEVTGNSDWILSDPISAATGGEYTVSISGEADTLGAYRGTVVLNSTFETEMFDELLSNDEKNSSQDISVTAIPLGSNGADRLGVRGDLNAVEDWFAFTLDDGQSATILLDAANDLTFDIVANNGTLAATGRSHDEFASYFQGFGDTTTNEAPDTYFVRVYSETSAQGEYEVVILRDAEFDRAFLADDWMMLDGALGYITNVIDVNADPDVATTGAVLDNFYDGITLSNNYGGSVFAVEADFATSTGTHVFAPSVNGADGWQSALDELRIDFDVLTDFLSIDAVAKVHATRGFLRAYNSEGVFVEQVLGDFLFPGQTQSLAIQRPSADIAYAIVGGLGPTPVPFDNLVFRAPGGEDVYKLSVIAGDQIQVEGFLPGSGPHEFVNSLGDDADNDLQLELVAPDGTSLATSGLVGFDHEATKTGVYELVVSTIGRFGEYYVAVDGTTGSNVPIEVTSVTPPDGTLVIGFPETIQVEFSSALDPATVEAGDVAIGGLAATAVVAVDDYVYEFTTDPAANLGFGDYLVEVAADVVSDLLGNSNEPFVSSFDVVEVNPFGRTGIPGSLTSSSISNTAEISSPDEVDTFSFPIAADETLAAVLAPVDATATMTIAISGGTVYTAAGPGDPVLLPATVVTESGPITVEVGSDVVTEYSIDLYRNVGIHDESLSVNDLTSTFVPLGSGRYAAVGEITGIVNPPVADIDEFELDLTGKVGTFLDVVVNTVVTSGGIELELIHPDGSVAATGSTSGGNFETGILDFEVTQDGVYTVKLIGSGRVEYQLLVAEDLVFDTENGRFPRSLDNTSGAFGYLSDLSDTYEVGLNAGDTLTVYTSTPHNQPNNAPRNQLDPRLRVTTPESDIIVDSSSLDGVNAQIVIEAQVSGTFLIEFSADSGVGEYSLHYLIDESVPGVDADFNDDGLFDCLDIGMLGAEIVAALNNPLYDLNDDGTVDLLDRDQWLLDAALANGFAGSYLVGDGNLDGNVDVSDFNLWNARKFSESSAWCDSDFNTDGTVDVSDFNLWNVNKFSSTPTARPSLRLTPRPGGPDSIVNSMEVAPLTEDSAMVQITPLTATDSEPPVRSGQALAFRRSETSELRTDTSRSQIRRVVRFDHFFADLVAEEDDSGLIQPWN